MDLITLRKLLGHAHFSTTAGYLHVTVERGVLLGFEVEEVGASLGWSRVAGSRPQWRASLRT